MRRSRKRRLMRSWGMMRRDIQRKILSLVRREQRTSMCITGRVARRVMDVAAMGVMDAEAMDAEAIEVTEVVEVAEVAEVVEVAEAVGVEVTEE